MITGKTKVLAVIGHPVGHSLSPVFQNAGIRACGLDYVYTAMPVEANRLQEAVQGMKALGIAGMNVTIPHKQAVMEYLDDIDEDAALSYSDDVPSTGDQNKFIIGVIVIAAALILVVIVIVRKKHE